MNSDKIQELEHGLAAAYRSLIYAKNGHGAQRGEKQEEEEEEVVVHLPHVLLKILSYLPLPDLYRMSGVSRIWKELISDDDRIWDAMPPDAEARKSSAWILVVGPFNKFNIVNIHSNKPERPMCGAPYTYRISIEDRHAGKMQRPNIGPSSTRVYRRSWNEVVSPPNVLVYSSVNPTLIGTTTPRTSEYRENISSQFVFQKSQSRRWHHLYFGGTTISHVETQACDCVYYYEHSTSRTLMPLFPEDLMPLHSKCPDIVDDFPYIKVKMLDIPYIQVKDMVRDDLRRGSLQFHHEELVASCNGLLCFLLDRYRVLVINPLTRAFRMLPNPKEVPQGFHDMRDLQISMSSTKSTGPGYLVILHNGTIGPMLVYNSESNVWTFHKSYTTITTTSLRPFRCECNVLFKMKDALRRLSGFDAEAGVAYELDPRAMPSSLVGETRSCFDLVMYRTDSKTQPWSRLFLHEGRIIYVAPLVFDAQRRSYVIGISNREPTCIGLAGFGVWELREDRNEDIMFVQLSRTPKELWQRVKLLQHVPGVRATFIHTFCFTKGSICCTIMTYLLEERLPCDDDIPVPEVFPLRYTIPPVMYDLGTNSWSSLPLNTTSVGLCGVEPSPWAKV